MLTLLSILDAAERGWLAWSVGAGIALVLVCVGLGVAVAEAVDRVRE
jgi:hypothetical protein